MKKVFLLMLAGTYMVAANAQELRKSSLIFNGNGKVSPSLSEKNVSGQHTGVVDNTERTLSRIKSNNSAEKTTSGGGRWYSYANYYVQFYGTGNYNVGSATMWNDTTAYFNYSPPSNNITTSVGANLDPTFTEYYDAVYFSGLTGTINLTNTDAYYIDSINLYGRYLRPNAATYIDTITLSIVYGGTSSTDNLGDYSYYYGMTGSWPSTSYPGHDTIKFLNMHYDSLANTAGPSSTGSASAISTTKIQLGSADTFSATTKVVAVGPTGGVLIPPGGLAGLSVSFHSGGHPDLFTLPPSSTDTVIGASGNVYWGVYMPDVLFHSTGSGASSAINQTYNEATSGSWLPINFSSTRDWEVGYWKYGGSGNQGDPDYYPMWVFGSPSSPSWQQYLVYDFHVYCPTCHILGIDDVNKYQISGVKTTPNPANDVLNILCVLTQASNVTINLTNMVGQIVATQKLANVQNVEATFNTTSLPAGIYMYSIQTENINYGTGRVVITH